MLCACKIVVRLKKILFCSTKYKYYYYAVILQYIHPQWQMAEKVHIIIIIYNNRNTMKNKIYKIGQCRIYEVSKRFFARDKQY